MANDLELKGEVIEAVSELKDPRSGETLLDAHMVENVDVVDGVATITVTFEPDHEKSQRWDLEDGICDRVEAIEGIREALVKGYIRGQENERASEPATSSPTGDAPAAGGPTKKQVGESAGAPSTIDGVGRVIAVASGKGGVGKSTVACNLALGLRNLGYTVGLLDVDVYGPSLPTLLGVSERPTVKDKRILPLEAEGLKLMSLGYLMDEDTPVIWRGPIVTGIIRQFLQDVDWSGIDYLIVDMPPGTGDAQLSLAQTVPVDGALIVTTPSDLALVDAARGLRMFEKLNIDVLGLVENMSHFVWPGAEELRALIPDAGDLAPRIESLLERHEKTWIFGKDGGRQEADRLGTEFCGAIPLDPGVRSGGDSGKPVVVNEPDSPVTASFIELARRVAQLRPVGEDAPKKGRSVFSFMKS